MSRPKTFNKAIVLISALVSLASIFLCVNIVKTSKLNQQTKADYAEINNIKNGLFSVEEWKKQLSVIIADEISKLKLSRTTEKELKKHVELQLDGLIDNVNNKIKEANKGSLKGWTKQAFINSFVDMKEIKKGIPDYADTIIKEIKKAEVQRNLKGALKKQVGQYFEKTFDDRDATPVDKILLKINASDIATARLKVDHKLKIYKNKMQNYSWSLIGISVLLFIMASFNSAQLHPVQYFSLLLMLLLLLFAGVITPMIDLEAKISVMSFTLLDHPVKFVNQVMYFQSKSIIDVFWIMMTDKKLEMKIVGILMVMFSIVFPLIKMLTSMIYFYNFRNLQENKWVQFFVFKSGKWSMADVMVIAIFMAYIGFNGIISNQFDQLKVDDPELTILTTNGTTLQPGFYIFMAFTLLALFMSDLIKRKKA